MKKLIYRAHRGNSVYAPENTMPAFEAAVSEGFEYIETDPQYTKDGVIVLVHDDTINRTCRNTDGSNIQSPLRVCDLTYEELLQYDAGIFMGEQFCGTKIPTLEELFCFAKDKNVIIALDKKIKTHEMDPLFDLVEKYNAQVSFSCADVERIQKIQSRLPNARIDYDGMTRDEDLQTVTSLVKRENLLVWVYLDKPNFSFVDPLRRTSPETCKRVKKYGCLGIANVYHTFDVREALQFEPDVLELS